MSSNSIFIRETAEIFSTLAQQIEEQDAAGLVDVIEESDVLTIKTPKGIFVINRNSVLQEIWLASPISGPYHFAKKDGKWQNRDGLLFDKIIADEFSNMAITLELRI